MRRIVLRILTTQTLIALVLTAKLGRIQFQGHDETWYDLNLSKVVERADKHYGDQGIYAVNDEGVKTYNNFVICAAHKSVPYGTLVETSRGIGVVLDYHTVEDNKTLIDIATAWKGGTE